MRNLDRERVEKLILFIEEVFDYCREYKFNRPEATERDVASFILITDMIEIARSVCILYDNKSRIGIESLLRMMIEKFLFLKLIFSNSKYATSFILSFQIHNLDLIQKVENGDEFALSFASKLNIELDQLQEKTKQRFSNINDKEKRDFLLHSYKECFEFEIKDRKLTIQLWYNLDGHIPNIYELSKKVGEVDLYQTLYKSFSSEVHSTSLNRSFNFVSSNKKSILGYLSKESFNSLKSNDELLTFLSTFLIDIYKLLKERYYFKSRFEKKIIEIIGETISPNNLLRHFGRKA